jgi:hypothetical protein
MMSDLELEVSLEDEDLFDDEAERRLMEEHAPEPKAVPPKKQFASTKKALANLTRESMRKRKEEKRAKQMIENPSENFKNQVGVLGDHVLEWCTYKAQQGEWRHVYEMSKMDEVYFMPLIEEVRRRMQGVILMVQENPRRITIEWGSNES